MALPTVETPTYDIFLTSLDKKIKYRPFLVREEKILLMAIESNDEKETVTSLESLIIKDNNNSNQNNQESEIDKSLEKSILDEIIKN